MLNIITLCVSIAFNDVPAETVCEDVATDLTPSFIVQGRGNCSGPSFFTASAWAAAMPGPAA